jgi:ornithine cyclodeaminase
MGLDWHKTVNAIASATRSLGEKDYAQPIKPYLRYRDPNNRIIAMPAFIGGDVNSAGIKWIASFPTNIDQGLPRASSVLILNHVETGIPQAVFNGGLLSAIRTASVSGLMLREYQRARQLKKVRVGITGFGPIGRTHLQMLQAVLGDTISEVKIYDPRIESTQKSAAQWGQKVTVVENWPQAYRGADIFITCTVAKARYIDLAPKEGSLQLNVSLRDYQPEVLQAIDVQVVDNWEEVCRENTDIEWAHRAFGLKKEDTLSIDEFILKDGFAAIEPNKTVMFNPMGMAIYDMAIARYFFDLSEKKNMGVVLEGN